jgi:hypothetical protein
LPLGWKSDCFHATFVLFPAPVQWHINNRSKFDAQCDIAEQSEAKNLTERLNWSSNTICKDAPQLCFEFAAKHFITQEAICETESFSKDRFDRLSEDLVEGVRNVVDSQRVTELTFTLPRPI